MKQKQHDQRLFFALHRQYTLLLQDQGTGLSAYLLRITATLMGQAIIHCIFLEFSL
jgi:hypothetical protein